MDEIPRTGDDTSAKEEKEGKEDQFGWRV